MAVFGEHASNCKGSIAISTKEQTIAGMIEAGLQAMKAHAEKVAAAR